MNFKMFCFNYAICQNWSIKKSYKNDNVQEVLVLIFCVTVPNTNFKMFCFNYAICQNLPIQKSKKNIWPRKWPQGHHWIGLKTFQMLCFMTFVQIWPPLALNISLKAKWPHLNWKMTLRSNFEVTIGLVFKSSKWSVLWHLSKFDLLRQ